MIRPDFRSFCAKALTVCVTVFFFTPFEDVGASSSSVTMTAISSGTVGRFDGVIGARLTNMIGDTLRNKDFLITYTGGSNQFLGGGSDEDTSWTFDFTQDPNYSAVPSGQLESALLTLTLHTRSGVDNDIIKIEGLPDIISPQIQSLSGGFIETIQLELLDFYSSQQILSALALSHNGQLRMLYSDDAIINFAKFELTLPTPTLSTHAVDKTDPTCNDTAGMPFCSVGAALAMASSSDTISIAAGIYVENITVDKNVILRGAGADRTIVEAGGPVITIESNSIVAIEGIGITKGQSGGVLNRVGATVTFLNCSITDNFSMSGGGAIFNEGTVELINSTVAENDSGGNGGGIYNNYGGLIRLMNSTVSSNFNCAIPQIGCQADGGGVFNMGRVELMNCTVSDNRATTSGGGIHNMGTLIVTNSTIAKNHAKNGGGISTNYVAKLINSTVSENEIGWGAGVGAGIFGPAELSNTIVANNIIRTHYPPPMDLYRQNCSENVTSFGHNLDSDGTCGLNPELGDLSTIDPILGPFLNSETPGYGHFGLRAGSPAIDAGDNTLCPSSDQLGISRPIDGNGDGIATCDIGAIELPQNLKEMVYFKVLCCPFTFAFEPLGNYKRSDFSCPDGSVGLFWFQARLDNISDKTLSILVVEVDKLTNNLLVQARGPRRWEDTKGAGLVGERGVWVLPTKYRPYYGDGELTPEEKFDIFHFFLCLDSFEKFIFKVNLLGKAQ